MRGSPLIRALLAFCLIALLGWPLWTLTHPTGAVAAAPISAAVPERKVTGLQLDFTVLPRRFSVLHLEKEVWTETAPQPSMEHSLSLVFPPEGVDLVFHIEWPEDAPLAAARVRLTDPAGETHEQSIWGKGTVDEPLSFP